MQLGDTRAGSSMMIMICSPACWAAFLKQTAALMSDELIIDVHDNNSFGEAAGRLTIRIFDDGHDLQFCSLDNAPEPMNRCTNNSFTTAAGRQQGDIHIAFLTMAMICDEGRQLWPLLVTPACVSQTEVPVGSLITCYQQQTT